MERFLYRIIVVIFCVNCAPIDGPQPKNVIEICLQEHRLPIDSKLQELSIVELVRLIECMNAKCSLAMEDASYFEFLMNTRSKSEVFEDDMIKYTGFKGDVRDDKAYKALISRLDDPNKLPKTTSADGMPAQIVDQLEFQPGIHYRKWILILHFADDRISKQLESLRNLLNHDRENYHNFANSMQRLYGILSKDHHGRLLNPRYIKRQDFGKFIRLLSEELKIGVETFILSETSSTPSPSVNT